MSKSTRSKARERLARIKSSKSGPFKRKKGATKKKRSTFADRRDQEERMGLRRRRKGK